MSSLVVRRADYLATTDRATLIELLDGYTRNPLRGGAPGAAVASGGRAEAECEPIRRILGLPKRRGYRAGL